VSFGPMTPIRWVIIACLMHSCFRGQSAGQRSGHSGCLIFSLHSYTFGISSSGVCSFRPMRAG
jgi:hypothetical protein